MWTVLGNARVQDILEDDYSIIWTVLGNEKVQDIHENVQLFGLFFRIPGRDSHVHACMKCT